MGANDGAPTIVVGYDGSDAARAALEYARRHAGAGGRAIVVHAYDLPAVLLGLPNYDRLLEERQRQGRVLLDNVSLGGDADNLETELIGGSPADAIAQVARIRDADEIVVGSRGRSRARVLLGSVSIELLHVADRPVVVIPPAAIEERRR